MALQVEEGYDVDTSCEEYQLLQAYCTKRSWQTTKSPIRAEGPLPPPAPGSPLVYPEYRVVFQGPGPPPVHPQWEGVSQCLSHFNVPDRLVSLSGPVASIFKKKKGAADDSRDVTGVADRLTQIADAVRIGESSSLEPDSPEDPEDVIQKLVELLKNSGDQLNEEIQRNHAMQTYLQNTFTYALFEEVTSRFQEVVSGGRAGRVTEQPDRLERQQIAVAFEVTSRLSAADLLPMSRAMGYGTRYIQIHHSSWVKHQGGWKKAFDSEAID